MGGDGTCCGMSACVSCSVETHCGSQKKPTAVPSSWGSGMGASSVEGVGSGFSDCVSR